MPAALSNGLRHSCRALGGQGFKPEAAGDGQQVGFFQAGGQARIAGQDDGEDGAGVQFGTGQQVQFGQDRGVHLLGFVDEEQQPIGGGLNVGEPFLAQSPSAVPTIIGREDHPEQMAKFAVEVGHFGLGPGQDADAEVPQIAQVLGEDAQSGAFTNAVLAHRQGEAAFADLVLSAPAEALDGRGNPQRGGGHLGGEGVEVETVEVEQSFIHEGSSGG